MKSEKKGLTRRQMAAGLAAAPPLLAQQQPKSTDELAAALEQLKRNSAALRKFELPTLAEPSFVFKP